MWFLFYLIFLVEYKIECKNNPDYFVPYLELEMAVAYWNLVLTGRFKFLDLWNRFLKVREDFSVTRFSPCCIFFILHTVRLNTVKFWDNNQVSEGHLVFFFNDSQPFLPSFCCNSGASQAFHSQGHMEPPFGLWQYDCWWHVKLWWRRWEYEAFTIRVQNLLLEWGLTILLRFMLYL